MGGVKSDLTKKADGLWDGTLTIRQNARRIGMTVRQAYTYVQNHRKPFNKSPGGRPAAKLKKKSGAVTRKAAPGPPLFDKREAEKRKLLEAFHNGGKPGAKAARKLGEKFGIRASFVTGEPFGPKAVNHSGIKGAVFPFVSSSGHRQMKRGTAFTNPNYDFSVKSMRRGAPGFFGAAVERHPFIEDCEKIDEAIG